MYAIARALLPDRVQALTAAALFAVLPPFPGYLFVAYPELVVSFVFLAGLAVLVHARGRAGAAAAGVLFALGALFRETLLLALPLYLVRLPPRTRWRAFFPPPLATLVLVVVPFAGQRAVHPNALYPSALEEARRSEHPLATLAADRPGQRRPPTSAPPRRMDPETSAEDAVLALIVVAGGGGRAGRAAPVARKRDAWPRPPSSRWPSSPPPSSASTSCASGAESGEACAPTWPGCRSLLVFATPLLFAPRRRALTAVLALAAAAAALSLDLWQIRFFNRYKGSDLEDQARNAAYLSRYLDAYHPQRIASRSFLYGFQHYPIEVIWSLPRDGRELAALNQAISYEFLALHEKSPLLPVLRDNPRFLRINKDDRGAEFLIWRRLY